MADRGVGVAEPARQAGVHPDTVGAWLAGHAQPDLEQATAAAGFLDVRIADLFPTLRRPVTAPPPATHRQPLPTGRGRVRLLTPAEVLAAPPTGEAHWERHAARAQPDQNPERWWPQGDPNVALYARAVCATRGVLGDCRDAFLSTSLEGDARREADRGIWAGLPGRALRAQPPTAGPVKGLAEPRAEMAR